jgi:hypothetical protein
MLEAIEIHAQHLAFARMLCIPHSVIRFAQNGSFELAFTYYFTNTKVVDDSPKGVSRKD